MNIIATSFYFENYLKLAEKTVDGNLKDYCYKHGYACMPFYLGGVGGTPYEIACRACRNNTELLLKILNEYPYYDYVWHRDCDSIITNTEIKLEHLIERYPSPQYEIITGSDKAGISMGQVLVHNTPTARNYLREILDGIDSGKYEHEQKFMWSNLRDFIAVTDQRVMNSYDCESRLESLNDLGNWREGDFLVHLAGLNLEQKMSVVDKWLGRVK